jgi:iron complex outermembrane receptor protein
MTAGFFAASALTVSLQAWAEAAGDTDTLETVYVTARKLREDLQRVPLPITVLNGHALSDSNDSQIQQLSLKAPSLLVTSTNPRNTTFALRGLGNNPTNDGLSTSVGIYMDGVYLGRQGMAAFDLMDVDQVEVLRGPQGTLFGKNTTAGAVTITTMAPEFVYRGAGAIRVGDLGFHQAQISITGPLSEDVAFRLSAYDTDRNGYLHDTFDGRHLLSLHRKGIRGQLLYRPLATFSWRMIAEYGREQDSSGAALLYSSGPDQGVSPTFVSYDRWATNLGFAPLSDRERFNNSVNALQQLTERQYAVTSLINWQLDGITLDSITGWRDWRYAPHIDTDYSSADVIRDGGTADIDREFSEEIHLAGSISDLNYVAGTYFSWRNILGDAFTQFGSQYSQGLGALGIPALNNGTTYTYSDITNQNYAVFLQATWRASPRWNLTGGVRETYESEAGTTTRSAFSGGNGTPPPNLGPYSGAFSTDEWTPSALFSLDYDAGNSVLIYAVSSYGAKAGGFNPVAPAFGNGAFQSVESLKVKPEQTANLELGLKSALLDQHVTLNVNGYWDTVFDYQTASLQIIPNVERKSLVTNVGSVRSQGFEADLMGVISPEVRFTSSLSYNDAHYLSFANGPAVQGAALPTQDLSGRPLQMAPAWTMFSALRYTHPISPGISVFVDGELMLRSGYFGYIDDSVYSRVPSAHVVNVQLGLTVGRADMSVWVDNVSDQRIFPAAFPAATGAGGYMASSLLPRTFGLTVRYAADNALP